ncbi:hypothetical protein EV177_007039 [Coemansia sp. RSA 1804]|nr:hypothetical protein EV177_007039 [Coemansia sp. RSA 1804]
MKPVVLKIHLDTPVVCIYGDQLPDPSNTAPAAQQQQQEQLSGTVELSLRTATRIQSVSVTFFGEQITRLPPHTVTPTTARCIADIVHSPPLLAGSSSSPSDAEKHPAGTHMFPFRFPPLPGNLPTSTALSFGHTRYTVRAQVIVVSGLRRTEYLAEEPLALVRCPQRGSEWAFRVFDALHVSTHWADRIQVTAAHAMCALLEDTPATLAVTFEPMEKRFELVSLDAVLRETHCALSSSSSSSSPVVVHRESRTVARTHADLAQDGAELGDHSTFDLALSVPSSLDRAGMQYSCVSETSRVTHRLVVTAVLRSPEGVVVEITLPSRVWVLPRQAVDGRDELEEGAIGLPRYQNTGGDRLVETARHGSSTNTVDANGGGGLVPLDLPPYSLPVCLSCGKEDVSVLECRTAIFHRSRMPEDASIEDLCVQET